jgi:hypothetical protein
MPPSNPGRNTSQVIRKVRAGASVSPDAADRAREARGRTSRPTPDQADRSRSPKQQVRDRTTVAKTIRVARTRAVTKQNRGSGTRAVKRAVSVVWDANYGPMSANRNGVVTADEAAKLRARGVNVRRLTPAESRDVGATVGVRNVTNSTPVRMAQATGIGIAQDPKRSIPATGRGFRDALTGIPSSIAAMITDPEGVARDTVKDYGRRYGDVAKPGGVKRTADRVSKEGAAPEILDATILLGGTGAAAGRALTAPAAAGRLGARAARVATEARPAKRVSGGMTVGQEKSPNLIVAAGQRARDNRRVGKNRAKVARLDDRAQPVDAVKQLAAQMGEIPVSGRKAARVVAREKGRDLERMKREQRVEVDQGTRRALNSLSKKERGGF